MEKQRAKHGLWRFHIHSRELSNLGIRWWIDDELDRYCRRLQFREQFTNADAIARCAVRYIRMFGVRCVNRLQWNELCKRIAKRAGFTHHATLDSVLLTRTKRNPRISIEWAENDTTGSSARAVYKWIPLDVERRAAAFEAVRQARRKAAEVSRLEVIESLTEAENALYFIRQSLRSAKRAMKDAHENQGNPPHALQGS